MSTSPSSPFLLLDASDTAITLSWGRDVATSEGGSTIVEEIQMRKASTGDPSDVDSNVAQAWSTLSSSLKSGALRKKNLEPGTAYVFRRRARQEPTNATGASATEGKVNDGSGVLCTEDWGPWSAVSEPFETLRTGVRQGPAPSIKMREASAVLMEWSAIPGARAYEVQMSASGGAWKTIAPTFGATLLRKKGLEDGKLYRFRIRPVFPEEDAGRDEWTWSPSSPTASPAVLNEFLRSQLPEELTLGGVTPTKVLRSSLAGKVVAFYFSAHWCGPCRKYTPQLAQLYRASKAQNKAFEVIFVSLDSDELSMQRYHAEMPWLAVPFDHPFREEFASARNVNSIPRLIVTGRRGQDLSSNAVGMTWDQLVAWEAHG